MNKDLSEKKKTKKEKQKEEKKRKDKNENIGRINQTKNENNMNKTGKMKKRQLIHPIIYQTKKKQKPIETRKSTDNSNPSRKSRKIIETRNIKLMIDEIEQDVKKYLNRVKSKKRSMKDENSKKHQFEQQKFEQTEKSSSSTTTTIKEEKTKKEQKELKENPSSIIRSSVLSSSQNQFKSSKSTSKIYFPSESLQMSNFNSHPRSSLLHAFQLAEQINFTNHHLEQSQMVKTKTKTNEQQNIEIF